jgi:hypothetical protein
LPRNIFYNPPSYDFLSPQNSLAGLCGEEGIISEIRGDFLYTVLAKKKSVPVPICGGQTGNGTGFVRLLQFSPVSTIPPIYILIFILILLLSEERQGEAPEH